MSAILTRREAHPLMLEVVHLQHENWKKKKKKSSREIATSYKLI